MIAASALILLAGAAACPPSAPVQLAGGATLVRPVGRAEPLPFERLGPAPGITRPDAVHRTGAASDGDKPDAESMPDICAVAASQIA